MSKRIFRSIIVVVLVVLLAMLGVSGGVLFHHFNDMQKESLEVQGILAQRGVEAGGVDYLHNIDAGIYRFTLIDASGTVLFDSSAPAAEMENHADREEIREATLYGEGESSRVSATLTSKSLYRAVRLADGNILRVSVTQQTVLALLLDVMSALILVVLLAVLLAALLARRAARRLIEPLNDLDLDAPLENVAYDELSPLLVRIEQQQRQIGAQLEQLQQQKDEFNAVTANMNEGLVLLGSDRRIISINPAAQRLFGASAACLGQDILMLERGLPMQQLIDTVSGGQRGEITLQLAGRSYQLDATPVFSDDKLQGICLLAFDISDKSQAEQLRREFSANVSHELKTPLHSIMGAAELIEAGLVKDGDLPRFAANIRSEAKAMLAMIEDIIRLSQLDEGSALPREEVDLAPVAAEVAERLAAPAAALNVELALHTEPAVLNGVRQLLFEIIYNLADNAVKYNRPGGRVDISISKQAGGIMLAVADTGRGIPPEAQEHVFERFYRVDKSHARETGGTGLGLSIVKHAVLYHGAQIKLESTVDVGTTVTVFFPYQR